MKPGDKVIFSRLIRDGQFQEIPAKVIRLMPFSKYTPGTWGQMVQIEFQLKSGIYKKQSVPMEKLREKFL